MNCFFTFLCNVILVFRFILHRHQIQYVILLGNLLSGIILISEHDRLYLVIFFHFPQYHGTVSLFSMAFMINSFWDDQGNGGRQWVTQYCLTVVSNNSRPFLCILSSSEKIFLFISTYTWHCPWLNKTLALLCPDRSLILLINITAVIGFPSQRTACLSGQTRCLTR